MKDFVVYTVMTGDYDNILQPLVVDDRFDFVLFTDVVLSDKIGAWQVRPIAYENDDKVRKSRYPKLQPHVVLPEYKAWLYIDANIQISDQFLYNRFEYLFCSDVDWAGVKHPERDCIYDEAYFVMSHCLLIHEVDAFKLCNFLKKETYPQHLGLYENNVIYRRNVDIVREVDDCWWNMYQIYARRDQLSLMYAIWKKNMCNRTYIFPSNEHAQNTSHLKYFVHGATSKRKFVYTDVAEIRRARYRDFEWCREFNMKLYYALYSLPYTPHIFLKCWELVMGVIYQVYKRKR